MIIADKIKAVCKAQKTTLFALETKLGLGNGTIGKWGKNGRVPNYSNLNAVCSELGVSVEDIMRDDDVVPASNKNVENAKKAPDPKIEGEDAQIAQLIAGFSRLSPQQKSAVLAVIEGYQPSQE